MLNYIWIALIAVGILVAAGNDLRDEVQNPYRNGDELLATLEIQKGAAPSGAQLKGVLVIPADEFNAFYGIHAVSEEVRQPVVLAPRKGASLVIESGDATPRPWSEMANYSMSKGRLTGTLRGVTLSSEGGSARVRFVLEPIRFVKLKAVTQAALDYAGVAVTIAIGLIGIMALWLGVMKVAEEAGLLRSLVRLLAPILRLLFPDVPAGHPALAAMVMNIAANMLGLSNAATPMGLKAMEELNKLNPKEGTATNAMVTFLAINTGGLILIPATAIAVRAAAGSANPGIIIGTSILGALAATIAGVAASKILQRLPHFKKALEESHE